LLHCYWIRMGLPYVVIAMYIDETDIIQCDLLINSVHIIVSAVIETRFIIV
jgi:hypothetical protein